LKQLLDYPHEAERTPFQINCFSENLVAAGIEPETSVSVGTEAVISDMRNIASAANTTLLKRCRPHNLLLLFFINTNVSISKPSFIPASERCREQLIELWLQVLQTGGHSTLILHV
jgi:hypothetical protein